RGKNISRVPKGLKTHGSQRPSSLANLTVPGLRGMHVWTARWVKHHATGNEVPPAEYTGYAALPIRRLAGVLAGRLEPTPHLLPGSVSSGRTLSPVNTPPPASSRRHRHSIAFPNFRRTRLPFAGCVVS